jgi:hypothetical protein
LKFGFKHPFTRSDWASISASLHLAGNWGLFVLFMFIAHVSYLLKVRLPCLSLLSLLRLGAGVPLVHINLGWDWVAI